MYILDESRESRLPAAPFRAILLVLVIAAVGSGCARKQVAIPPEYKQTPSAYSAPQYQPPPSQELPPVTKYPDVKSQDFSPPAPPAQKKVTPRVEQPSRPVTEPAGKPGAETPTKQENAKRQASTQLVNQAKGQLDRDKPDTAIRTLEKAIQIDARNGDAFILLARAWQRKGEQRKALEFARKAELLFQKQPSRQKEVYLLESELYREMGDSVQAARSGRKASGSRQKTTQ